MTKQIGCFFTTLEGDGSLGNAFSLSLMGDGQSDEHFAHNWTDLFPVIAQYESDLPSRDFVEKHEVVISPIVGGIGLVYVYADHTRINTFDNDSKYLLWWSYNLDRQSGVPEKPPADNPNASSLSGLQNYLVANTDKTMGEIAPFLHRHFGVANDTALRNWMRTNGRNKTVNKMATMFATQEQQNA